MDKLRVGTCFDGIDAPLWALQQLGIPYEHLWGCEKDKFARKTIEANYRPYKLYHDIYDMNPALLAYVDLFIAGFPCQPFSQSGLQKGLQDVRSNVIFTMLDIVKSVLPPIVILENVKGFITNKKFRVIQKFIFDKLSEFGYAIKYKILNCKHYGVPQNRERVFIVAFLDHNEFMHFDFPRPIKLKKFLKDILEPVVDQKYVISDTMIKWFEETKKKNVSSNKMFSYTIADIDGAGIAKTIPAGYGKDGSECLIKVLQCELDVNAKDQDKRIYDPTGIAPSITTMGGGYQHPKIKTEESIVCFVGQRRQGKNPKAGGTGPLSRNDGVTYAVTCNQNSNIIRKGQTSTNGSQGGTLYGVDGVSPAILSGPNGYASGIFDTGDHYRRLTPREIARLFDYGDELLQVVSDTQMYRQLGNSIPTNMIRGIFYNLLHMKFPQIKPAFN